MKKVLFLLTAISLLSACSSNFSITKRRYNKGFYIATSHKNEAAPQHKSDKKVQPVPSNTSVETVIVKAETTAPENSAPTSPATKNATVNKLSKIAPIAKTVIATRNKVAPIKHTTTASIDIPKNKAITTSNHQNRAADTNTILLVILAILIPCLAVYLKDDKISTLFWITLVLQILLVTWVVAMVLAILHVMGKL